MNIRLSEIADAVGAWQNGEDKKITRVVTDSREAYSSTGSASGVLFVAIRGERTDGHKFIKEIIAAGGNAIVERDEYALPGTLLVKDSKQALGRLSAYYRTNYLREKKLVLITGSVGKTTTKEMTAVAFSSKKVYKTEGNRNSLIGLPLTVLDTPDDAEIMVLEAGMSNKNEIAKLSNFSKPDVVIITNIGNSHIEFLGSIETILEEKFSAVTGLKIGGTLILNGDDKMLASCAGRYKRTLFYSSGGNKADYTATRLAYNDGVSLFKLNHPSSGYSTDVVIPAMGEHNVQNALAAFTAADILGVPRDDIIIGLKSFSQTGNRQRIYTINNITVIADCYNASPESMNAALTVLSLAKGRKIAVLGDMLELGDKSAQLHIETGANAKRHGADEVIALGDFAEQLSIGYGGCRTFGLGERTKAVEYVSSILKPGDTVLFKASNRLDFSSLIKEIPVIN